MIFVTCQFPVGGVTDTFFVTTADASAQVDTAPDAFSFVDQTAVALSTPVTSNSMIVNGINARTEITIGDVQFSVNGGGYVSVAGEVNNCDSVTIKLDSSASYASSSLSTLTIGGVSGSFSITTLEQIVLLEATPEAFNFSDQSDVAIGVTMISNSVVVSGINAPARLAIRNGQYSINGGI